MWYTGVSIFSSSMPASRNTGSSDGTFFLHRTTTAAAHTVPIDSSQPQNSGWSFRLWLVRQVEKQGQGVEFCCHQS